MTKTRTTMAARTGAVLFSALTLVGLIEPMAATAYAAEQTPAKELFGSMKLPVRANPTAFGFYSKGCIAGAVAIPTDGPTWQAMRLSRNRRWGHPLMISLIEQLSRDAVTKANWPGLLLGDISQPRGGPMLSGHASHQIGLDADIWLTPMPQRTLTAAERESISATSMLDTKKFLTVNPKVWNGNQAKLIMLAASYPQVERIFVNPAIKKKLCDTWRGDRTFMGKVRPIYGHDYHFHIRMSCPADSPGCRKQAPVTAGDGCDKSLAWWFTDEPWAKPTEKPKNQKPVKPRFTTLDDLPNACRAVLAGVPASEAEATMRTAVTATAPASDGVEALIRATQDVETSRIPVPLPRPSLQ